MHIYIYIMYHLSGPDAHKPAHGAAGRAEAQRAERAALGRGTNGVSTKWGQTRRRGRPEAMTP